VGSAKDMSGYALLDTSILLLIAEGELSLEDVLENLPSRPCIPKCVVDELERLARDHSERSRKAKWVLENIVPRTTLCIYEERGESVDECLMKLAAEIRGIVVTSDLELAKRARRRGIAVAIFRKAKRGIEVLG